MKTQAVSVIITNYNQGKFAARALNSVLQQTFPIERMEIIIIDDGSTDNSVDLINKMIENLPNVFLITKKNGGTASARNAGVKAASNDILFFLDIDDEYLPNKVTKTVEIFDRYPNIGCVYSDYYEVMIDGQKKLNFKPPFNRNMLRQQCTVSTNCSIHKQVFDKIGGFDENIWGCEDYDVWLRGSLFFLFYHIAEPLFIYYNHGENKTAVTDSAEWQREEQQMKAKIEAGNYYIDY